MKGDISMADECAPEPEDKNEIPSHGRISIPKYETDSVQFISQVYDLPEDLIGKQIVRKIEEHLSKACYNLHDRKIVLLERTGLESIVEKISTIGTVITTKGFMCLGDNFILSLTAGHHSSYSSLIIEIFAQSVEKIIEVRGVLNSLFVGMTKDATSCEIRWFYSDHKGMVRSDYVPEILDDYVSTFAYPFIPNLNEYISDYESSSEKVLILMGPPGTGKTRLIRYIIRMFIAINYDQLDGKTFSAFYTTDSNVIDKDQMFIEFMTSTHRIMVLEDVDFSLRDRSEGNTSMYRLLASSDGLIQSPDKKIIISTNVGHERDIDAALIRPGRCFDLINFRKLTPSEGTLFLRSIGVNREVDDEKSLAELYKYHTKRKSLRLVDDHGIQKVGFK